MMTYRLEFSKDAMKQLGKMDQHQAQLITQWLYANIDGIEDPRTKGKGLEANLSGLWRYRIGNYRVISVIEDDQLVVLAISVGHRRDVYRF